MNALHAKAFNHAIGNHDWLAQVHAHSLGWVCAFDGDTLIGWANVPWDGAQRAFIIDPVVLKRYERQGVGTAVCRSNLTPRLGQPKARDLGGRCLLRPRSGHRPSGRW